MTQRNPGRLAIHRRSDEIAFLQHRLRTLSREQSTLDRTALDQRSLEYEALVRERDLADELLHTRQIEPLGETLQRRLAMAERICRDLAHRTGSLSQQIPRSDGNVEAASQSVVDSVPDQGGPNNSLNLTNIPYACWVAEVERRALVAMLNHWWAWLR